MSASQKTFHDLIAENKRNSVVLVAAFCLFTVIVMLVLGLAIIGFADPGALSHINFVEAGIIVLIAVGIALASALFGYYAGDKVILGVSQAHQIRHDDDPELFNVVEEMAIAAGTPTPRVYVIDDTAPNAFATGRDPEHASIAITTGLRGKLTREELQGVIAHEMSHVRNYDIRLMLLMAVLVGTIAMLSDFLWQAMRWSSFGGSRRRDRDREGGGLGPLVIVIMVLAVILAIVAPVLAQIIQLAVSRQREYLADASAVELTRYPQGLASALRKIDADSDVLEVANRGTAHLYIANPIKKFEKRAGSVFASHPPIEDRVARLESLLV